MRVCKKYQSFSALESAMHLDRESEIIENGLWQGTIIFMEITTSREIDPNDVVGRQNLKLEHMLKWNKLW